MTPQSANLNATKVLLEATNNMFQLDLFKHNQSTTRQTYNQRLEYLVMMAMGDDYEDAVRWDKQQTLQPIELAPSQANL